METKAPMGVGTSNNNNSFSAREEVEHVICKYIVSNRLMCRGVWGEEQNLMVDVNGHSASANHRLCAVWSRFLLPISSRQFDGSISIADFFNHSR